MKWFIASLLLVNAGTHTHVYNQPTTNKVTFSSIMSTIPNSSSQTEYFNDHDANHNRTKQTLEQQIDNLLCIHNYHLFRHCHLIKKIEGTIKNDKVHESFATNYIQMLQHAAELYKAQRNHTLIKLARSIPLRIHNLAHQCRKLGDENYSTISS